MSCSVLSAAPQSRSRIAVARDGAAGGREPRSRRGPPPLPLAAVAPAPSRGAAAAAAAAAGADAASSSTDLPAIVRVVGEAQADAAALAVDLDHADVDLVALVEHVLDRLDALAGRDVGDVQQAVGALGELDERAERRRLDDLAGELVADLDLLHHRPDALDERVAELAVGRVDQHLAVVVDVDLRLELLGQAADRLAALADQQADLRRVDLDL